MNALHTANEVRQRTVAEVALGGLTDPTRIHFALKIMLESKDPDAVAALRWAQHRIGEHADILLREALEQEAV